MTPRLRKLAEYRWSILALLAIVVTQSWGFLLTMPAIVMMDQYREWENSLDLT